MSSDTRSEALASTLSAWTDQGWLRRLDSAMADFVHKLDPDAPPALRVACAVLTHMEGRGHTCLPLASLVSNPTSVLAWPAASHEAIVELWATLPPTLTEWIHALRTSHLVRYAPIDSTSMSRDEAQPDLGQPLVLSDTKEGPLLYLRRYWIYEEQVAHAITACTDQPLPVDAYVAREWLEKLFAADDAPPSLPPSEAKPEPEIDWQKIACALALRGRLTLITGGPGTGKTYTAARLLALLLAMSPDPSRLKVALAAPTGKAAARLRQSIDQSLQPLQGRLGSAFDLAAFAQRIGQAKTVHALLGARPDTRRFKHDERHPLDLDVLIVDESSMVHLEMMAALLQALPPHAKLILLGDKDQLASVEAGAVLGDLCAHAHEYRYTPATQAFVQATCAQVLPESNGSPSPLAQQTVMLRASRRFGGAIGQLARAINAGHAYQASHLFGNEVNSTIWRMPKGGDASATVIALAVQGRSRTSMCYAHYLHLIQSKPPALTLEAHTNWVKQVLRAFEEFRVLCAVHEGPLGDRALNRDIQKALAAAGWIKPNGEWFVGRPIMVTRNDAALGVFNGDVGVVLPGNSQTESLRAYFLDGDHLRSVAVSRLAHVETAFAMTVHKSQGSEFAHTVLALAKGSTEMLTKELIYTGITRARSFFSLVEECDNALETATQNPLKRNSGLRYKLTS